MKDIFIIVNANKGKNETAGLQAVSVACDLTSTKTSLDEAQLEVDKAKDLVTKASALLREINK